MQTLHFLRKRLRKALRLKLALRLVWKSAPNLTIANGVLILLQGPLPLLSLYVVKIVIDRVVTGASTPGTSDLMRTAGMYLGVLVAIRLIESLVKSLATLVQETHTQVVTDYVYDLLHAKSMDVDLAYYEQTGYYDTLHRAQQEAAYRPVSILHNMIQLGRNSISLLAMLGVVWTLHWGGVLVLALMMIPQSWAKLSYANQRYHWQRDHTSTLRESWYFHWILTGKEHAKEIRVFGLGDAFRQRFRAVREHLRREKFRLLAGHTLREFGAQIITTLVVFGIYTFLLARTLQGRISPGELVMYYQAFHRGQTSLQGMLSSVSQLYEDNLFLAHLYEFLELESIVNHPEQPVQFPVPIRRGLVFDQVSFHYPEDTREVLTKISFEILPGEKIALVGENGAGKTTLIKLLCHLYEPTSGAITVDGTNLWEFETSSLRQAMSIIFQDYVRYNLTARENIELGNLAHVHDGADGGEAHIRAAARQAGADDIITRLKFGYETRLGKWFEGSEELSAGQWQKIALARAFLRDAQILVLDEPTSALDAKAEYEVFSRFRDLTENRTAILISHRFSTVRMADRIYVLSGGTIAESGSHTALMQYGGIYAAMFDMQARHYR